MNIHSCIVICVQDNWDLVANRKMFIRSAKCLVRKLASRRRDLNENISTQRYERHRPDRT